MCLSLTRKREKGKEQGTYSWITNGLDESLRDMLVQDHKLWFKSFFVILCHWRIDAQATLAVAITSAIRLVADHKEWWTLRKFTSFVYLFSILSPTLHFLEHTICWDRIKRINIKRVNSRRSATHSLRSYSFSPFSSPTSTLLVHP